MNLARHVMGRQSEALMMSKARIFLLGVLTVLSWSAAPAAAEWFGDLYGGVALSGKRDISVGTDTTLRNVEFGTATVVGGRAGYWFEDHDYLAIALDVLHYQPDIGSQTVRFTPGPTARVANIDLDVTALSIDLMLRFPLWRDEAFPKGRLQPYFAMGPTVAITKANDTTNFGPPNNQSHVSSPAGFNVGLGLFWPFHKHFGVFGEYRYLQFDPTFRFDPVGDVKFDIKSHLLSGGLSVRF